MDPLQSKLPSYTELQTRVYNEVKGQLIIGGEIIPDALRSTLKDEAIYIENSRLWEIMNATLLNEAYELALDKSTSLELLDYAKALKHCQYVIANMLHTLSK